MENSKNNTVYIPPPSPVQLSGNTLENWTFFKLQFANYGVFTGLNKKPNNVQVATLLSVIGKECLKIYTRLDIDEESKKSSEGIINSLHKYFQPEKMQFMSALYSVRVTKGIQNQQNIMYVSSDIQLRLGNLEICKSEFIRDRLVLAASEINLRKKLLSDANTNHSY